MPRHPVLAGLSVGFLMEALAWALVYSAIVAIFDDRGVLYALFFLAPVSVLLLLLGVLCGGLYLFAYLRDGLALRGTHDIKSVFGK